MQCVFCRELDHDHHHHLTSNTPRPPKQESLSLCLCPSARAKSQDALRRGNSRAVAAFESHQKAPRGPSHGMHRPIPHHMAATGSDTCVFFSFCFFVMRMCYLNSLAGDHSPSHMYVPCSCVGGLQRPRHTRGILQGFGINSVAISDHWGCLGDKDTSGPQPS